MDEKRWKPIIVLVMLFGIAGLAWIVLTGLARLLCLVSGLSWSPLVWWWTLGIVLGATLSFVVGRLTHFPTTSPLQRAVAFSTLILCSLGMLGMALVIGLASSTWAGIVALLIFFFVGGGIGFTIGGHRPQ